MHAPHAGCDRRSAAVALAIPKPSVFIAPTSDYDWYGGAAGSVVSWAVVIGACAFGWVVPWSSAKRVSSSSKSPRQQPLQHVPEQQLSPRTVQQNGSITCAPRDRCGRHGGA